MRADTLYVASLCPHLMASTIANLCYYSVFIMYDLFNCITEMLVSFDEAAEKYENSLL